jgi:hypothetical protein
LDELIKEVQEHYWDRGLVTRDRDPSIDSTGNGLLHMSLFYLILQKTHQLSPLDRNAFIETVDSCWKEPGLLNRSPTKKDLESRDDYVGVCAISALLETDHAMQIVKYGAEHGWSYDNDPLPFQWNNVVDYVTHVVSAKHSKFIGIVPFYKQCAGLEIDAMDEYLLAEHIRRDIHSDDVSGKMMTLLMSHVAHGEEIGFELVRWRSDFNSRYPNIGSMLSLVFGADHPLAKVTISV